MAKDIIEVEDAQLEDADVVTPEAEEETDEVVDTPKGKYGALTSAEDGVRRLSGMYKKTVGQTSAARKWVTSGKSSLLLPPPLRF